MSKRIPITMYGCVLAAALAGAPAALAETPSPTPVMRQAFAKLEQGPDELRWFVYRTRMIYFLRSSDVAAAYAAFHRDDARKVALSAGAARSLGNEGR
jgi:hypothetical protein